MKISFRTEDLKYIATLTSSSNDLGRLELREEELYRFLEDPAEQKNIQHDSLSLIDTFRRELRGYLTDARKLRANRQSRPVTLDETDKEKLRSLGYIVE